MVRLPLHVPEQGETDVRRNNAKRRGGQNGVNLKADGTSSGVRLNAQTGGGRGSFSFLFAWPGLKKYGLKEGDAENPSALVGQARRGACRSTQSTNNWPGLFVRPKRTRLTAQWAAVNRRLMIAVRLQDPTQGGGEPQAETTEPEEPVNHSQDDRRVYTNLDRPVRAPFRSVAGEPWIGPQWPWLAIVLWASVAIVGRRRHAVEWLLRCFNGCTSAPSPTQQARMETDREAGRTREPSEGSGDWRGSCLDSDRLDWSNTERNTREIENLAVALLGYWTAPPVLMMMILLFSTFLNVSIQRSGADVRSTWLQRQPTGNLASLNSDVLFLGSVQLDRIKNAIRAGGSPALFRGKLQR
ncbi:hypothetical protein ASPTUDRAFT_52329 [Aspergillus tubingensis CBS 134.48]|uniref:Uncharacterized protein n=1 Tax=Aspergillus tubingensis (strain CBS 134.48) TaxID=767770 RepID=A0A1L9NMK0_ASPTC|nr:hypothetical protein ASPTUDRAFT_52329 [Aspergillus tubingensis CBS 134.48]